nr:IclR family transcriptional regulator [uncultured Roseateles sp.]
MRTPKPKEDRHFVTALARGIGVLQAFRSGEERLSNQELAERCGLPKSTVTRLTYTLTRLGFLHHLQDSGRYRLGLATLTIGGTTLSRLKLREVARPLLQDLANRTRTMASLAMRDELSMIYIEVCRNQTSIVTLWLDIGSRLPMISTAVGRACLAVEATGRRQALLDRICLADPEMRSQAEGEIQQAIAELSDWGCVTSFGAWRQEINAIATPLALGKGMPLIVANSAAPTKAISPKTFLSEVRPQLLVTARAIEERYAGCSKD